MNSITACVERVVAIAGDHVAGAGHVDHLGVRDQLLQLADALVADDVADPTTHQQHRHVDLAGGAPAGRVDRPC